MDGASELAAIDGVRERLAARFPSAPEENVRLAVGLAYESLANARVRDFVPVLVEHEAREKLAHLI